MKDTLACVMSRVWFIPTITTAVIVPLHISLLLKKLATLVQLAQPLTLSATVVIVQKALSLPLLEPVIVNVCKAQVIC